jgi:integrase
MGTVDRWETRIRDSGLKASSIATKRQVFVSFLSHLNSHGAGTFEEVTESMVVDYFFSNEHLRGYMTCARLKRIMKECLSYFSDREYREILLYLPTIRNIKKNYPCLSEEESDRVLSVLSDKFSNLSCRDRAIGLLALLCGIRSCDIVNMKLCDINWDKETISIVQQKTGVPLSLPFCPLIGNIVYDYIIRERPELTGENHIFLINEREMRHVSRQTSHICEKILAEAGIVNRERTGFHLFRHRFGVMLLNKGVPSPVITAALGHSSPNTLDIYLDSDLVRLKECGLSIGKFPVRKEVFQ